MSTARADGGRLWPPPQVGGADPARGSGLIGLRDRAEALGGSIVVSSPRGEGTLILVELPLRLRHTFLAATSDRSPTYAAKAHPDHSHRGQRR